MEFPPCIRGWKQIIPGLAVIFLKVKFNGYSYILTSTEQPIVQGGFLLTSL
jgi:hypothetical protein